MKSLKYAKKINDETKAFTQLIESYCTKLNQDYMKQVLLLLSDIAKGENLDFDTLKKRYIKKETTESEKIDEIVDSDTLLDQIEFNNNIYYIDKKNDNIVYDKDSNIVGKYKNNTIIFSKSNDKKL
jgi:hypothetical protein